jgi:hypothetical protein
MECNHASSHGITTVRTKLHRFTSVVRPLNSELHRNDIYQQNPYITEVHCVSITKTSRFVLFKEIIAVYSENHNETH